MKISSSVVNSQFIWTYRDMTSFFSGSGFANTDNFSFSQILDPGELDSYFLDEFNDKNHLLGIEVPELRNKYILVNSDYYAIRNIAINTSTANKRMGIIKILPDGKHYQIMWGFVLGSKPTKYLQVHLLAHNELIKRNPQHRVIANVSSPYFQQFMYLLQNKDENLFTFKLWDSLTDLARLTPKGLGLVPTIQMPSKQANKMFVDKFKTYNVVARDKQNVLVSGLDWAEVINIGQSLERAATNAVTIGQVTNNKPYISKEYWDELEQVFKVSLNPEVTKFAQQTTKDEK